MEACRDFLNWLDPDISVQILMYLEDPSDLVHVSSVSRSWRDFVIANGLFKHLCLRMFPQLSRVACVMELNKSRAKKPVEVGSSYSMEWESLARDHRVYATLAQVCTSFLVEDCISEAISASSTDHYPLESIHNTLLPAYTWRDPYWSSKGQSDRVVPETLIYKLKSELCVIFEINICPFQELFLSSLYIYSANSVRFRMGIPKALMILGVVIWVTHCLVMLRTLSFGPILHQNSQWLRKVACRILGFQNLFFALVEFCRLSCWVGSRDMNWMAYSIYEILETSGTFVLKNDMQGKFYTPTKFTQG